MTHDPMCNKVTDHQSMEFGGLCICADLAERDAAAREDERLSLVPSISVYGAERYEQGQRDERERWEPMVQALTDELLAKTQPDTNMGAQYLAGYAEGQRDALAAAVQQVRALSPVHWKYDGTQDEYAECVTVDSVIAAIILRRDALAAIRSREEKP